ncbi:MAG: putative DsbA family dithiol-disulfide isomerase [Myxococcota bacterium]|jgi:predicted DsbA family dithiol-disulfide isomerase
MRIDIWSDIACPFCYIGKRHLEAALEAAGTKAEVVWHSFELDPTPRSASVDTDIVAVLMAKYRQSRAQTEAMVGRVVEMGAQAGLQFQFQGSVRVNTFDAHRTLHLAAESGRQDAAKERLLAAYFTEGADLSDPTVLAELLAEVGIAPESVLAALSGDDYADAVRTDEQMAKQLSIQGVPYFVFNQKYALSGAQPVDAFQRVIAQCQADAPPEPVAITSDACAPDGCEV